MIAENLISVTQRIARACEKSGRPPDAVRLVCVTKEAGIEDALAVLSLGVKDLGENRVQELASKYAAIGDKATWHLVGHLQTNKARDAVRISSLIHSVDSVKLAKEIDKEAKKIGKTQDILVQVNASGEATKFGITPDEAVSLIKEISLYPNINIKGLMTIAPEVSDPESVRPYFRALRELRDELSSVPREKGTVPIRGQSPFSELSMGMTNDFEVAIEEGATIIRIGRAIFQK
ncbi:MAG: YggS family pyridoxal phosphate-dependent enzyme [Candidatus Omnitrophica bacterium]|nr:YggS family pyridoxal phosphate-dependent enzyme [Candidatus Omnitrophota bacterium]